MSHRIEGDQVQICGAMGDILNRIGDKWSVMVVGHLTRKTMRFNELRHSIGGIGGCSTIGRGGGMRGMRMTMCWWNSNWLCGATPNPPRGAPGVAAAGAASNNSSAAGREGFVMARESTLSESV